MAIAGTGHQVLLVASNYFMHVACIRRGPCEILKPFEIRFASTLLVPLSIMVKGPAVGQPAHEHTNSHLAQNMLSAAARRCKHLHHLDM